MTGFFWGAVGSNIWWSRRKRKEMSTGGKASRDRSQPQLTRTSQIFCKAQLVIVIWCALHEAVSLPREFLSNLIFFSFFFFFFFSFPFLSFPFFFKKEKIDKQFLFPQWWLQWNTNHQLAVKACVAVQFGSPVNAIQGRYSDGACSLGIHSSCTPDKQLVSQHL